MGAFYTKALTGIEGIRLPPAQTEYAENVYWVYGILLDRNLPVLAKQLMTIFGEKRIGTRPFFYPMHWQPVFKRMGLFEDESYPVAEYLSQKGFYIPSGLTLKECEMEEVVRNLKVGLKQLLEPALDGSV